MERRAFLKTSGLLGSYVLLESLLNTAVWIPSAEGSPIPLASLQSALSTNDGMILVPSSAQYADMQKTLNLRHQNIRPQVRVLCQTERGIASCIQWARQNNIPLALRNGGHSYEGFSLSPGLVIDLRLMNRRQLSADKSVLHVQSGALLGTVYETVAPYGLAIAAGTCPTVGITGHTTGGGYGLLARPLGLACDSLLEATIIDAQGRRLTANEQNNSDLFWALRGAGSGSFGVITDLKFKTHQIKMATTFVVRWRVPVETAIQIATLWQIWAVEAPRGITPLLNCTLVGQDVQLTLVGQTITSRARLESELQKYFLSQIAAAPTTYRVSSKTWIEAVRQFSGGSTPYYIKGKSDYVKSALTAEALRELFQKMPAGVAVLFDAYGGAIQDKTDQDTGFAHRENTICSLQYYLQWSSPQETTAKLQTLQTYYQHLRPYMSGGAYFNYCDLDLGTNYAQAYWGDNVEHLKNIKKIYDPENVFTHKQGIPVS